MPNFRGDVECRPGINDAPALVEANVGFAIGTGTDVAIEAADITLMSGSLKGVAYAIEISQATMRNAKESLFGALAYNSLGIPIAAGVLYPFFGLLFSPLLAGAAMAASSVTVVANANRLRFFKARSFAEPAQVLSQVAFDLCVFLAIDFAAGVALFQNFTR